MIKHLCKNILFKNGMLDSNTMDKLELFFESLIWPPSISRHPSSLQPQVARGTGSVEADQWRSMITVFFFGLFMAWQIDGEIPNVDAAPSPPNTKNAAAQAAQEKLVQASMRENLLAQDPDATEHELEDIKTIKMDRSLPRHYEAHKIQQWALMHCHLVPYFHLAVHLEPQYYKYGPVPGWWTYRTISLNSAHAGGEMEGTMMRGWWKATLIRDLVTYTFNLWVKSLMFTL
ncbi:hypothetical protein B0H19DRAFT_969574 [Mycena capillaripes]|nr:hypothetical protein B0H19DRAFT_969574 [Mycena capillaripes]